MQIRNFSIIAHIDHGKSTLADRMIELTNTVEKRKMTDQVLDDMELEKEKGITIKMRPVRMEYKGYTLNLIDTPGHIDFSYEVSRALRAVEGCIMLVDATQGVQAQTLTTLRAAQEVGLTIIPVLSKVDSPIARIDDIKKEVCALLKCNPEDVLETSGKTGVGVPVLLDTIIEKIPAPTFEFGEKDNNGLQQFRSLVFDFQYSNHRGVIVFIRVTDGSVRKGDELTFKIAGQKFFALEVGVFTPQEKPVDVLETGMIGYIVTGIKQSGVATVGDTITFHRNPLPELSGYMKPLPVVWASIFPEDADDFELLKQSLGKLSLSDSAFSFEEESSGSMGRGFRSGFLGLLHLEIITERLKREYNLDLVIAQPSITYEVTTKDGKTKTVYSPSLFPEHGQVTNVREPWVKLEIITPEVYSGNIYQLLYDHEGDLIETQNFGDGRLCLIILMPLRELMRNFFDELKSVSSGYGSLSYEFFEMKDADVTRMDILVAEEPVEAFTRVIAMRRADEEANKAVDKLEKHLPRQMFNTKIQAKVDGRIIASRTLAAMRKDVTGYLYGGDVSRKNKLLDKQKKGKKKMEERGKGKVNISHDVFLKMMKNG